jgi:hypothetical protein
VAQGHKDQQHTGHQDHAPRGDAARVAAGCHQDLTGDSVMRDSMQLGDTLWAEGIETLECVGSEVRLSNLKNCQPDVIVGRRDWLGANERISFQWMDDSNRVCRGDIHACHQVAHAHEQARQLAGVPQRLPGWWEMAFGSDS